MPKISEHKEAHLRRMIRDAIAIDPLISMVGIKRVLERKVGQSEMRYDYVKRLVKKVTSEMMVVADREKVEERISYLRERNRIICDELLRMAFPPENSLEKPSTMDKRKALEAIARIEAHQVKLEMDLGLFTRHLGQIDVEHRIKPMDEVTRANVLQSMKAWDIKPSEMRKIDLGSPEVKEAKIITNEPTNAKSTRTVAPIQPIPAAERAGLVISE